MLWTAEAVEDLKKLALEGKSASHISAALGVGSRNAVIGKASRIGIKLSGGGRASVRGKGRPVRLGPNGRQRLTLGPAPTHKAPAVAAARDPQVSPGEGRAAWTGLWRSRDRRDATAAVRGNSRIRLPVAARRSEERGLRLLRAHAGGGPVLLRRPLPDGLPVAAGEAERAGAATISRPREFMAGGLISCAVSYKGPDSTSLS